MKVAIIGAGDVGSATAQRIVEADLADCILVDIIKGKAEGTALDLSSASAIMGHSRLISGTTDYKDTAGAEIVVVTCGHKRSPGQSRDALLLNNAKIIKVVSTQIAKYCPQAIVIVVTNPVDAMTYLTFKTTDFAASQVIGMGGVSDCARLNILLARELNTASNNIQSIIIGAHGDSMVALPRFSSVLGIPITELLPEEKISRIAEETRGFGAKVVRLLGQGSAYYGPSAAAFAIVDAIINDRKSLLCASVHLEGHYGLKELCIGVPVKIGAGGIEEIIELKLTEQEKAAFLASVKQTKDLIQRLGV